MTTRAAAYTLTPPPGDPTSHVIVAYDRIAKEIASVTPTNDPIAPISSDTMNYTVWTWDRWFGVRRVDSKKDRK